MKRTKEEKWMSIVLRGCLIAASLLSTILMLQKIRKSKIQIEDSIFWVVFSGILIVFSIFPSVAYRISDLVGTQSASNFIFMLVIFLLLVKVFSMTVRMSRLEMQLRELVQQMALDPTKEKEAKQYEE